MVVAQFVFLFLLWAIFWETSMELDNKTVNIIVKNRSTTIFYGLNSYQPKKWRQNVQNFAVN